MMTDVYIPVLKDTKDPHYRYKMPKLTTKIEGSGNGIKTVLTNMVAVARSLGRPPSYPTKYFGCELGAQVTTANEFIVNGAHDPEKLLNLLYGFIRKFVLCTKCNNPETLLSVSKDCIKQKCIACGHDTTINKSIHRLTSFIINHPPDGSNPNAAKSSKHDKKSKKSAEKTANGSSGADSNQNSSGNRAEDFADDDGNDDFDDEEFTASAYTERIRELCDGFNSDMILSDKKETANMFYKLVQEKKEANQLMDANVQRELVKEAERLSIKDKAVLILSELLFTENIIEEIKQYRVLFIRFCESKKAQKYLLGAFEKLVGEVHYDKLFNSSLAILKQFYDEDILDEETILEWSAKESKKYVSKDMSKKIHEKVAAFIKWLKEAEEESDEEEEDNDDEEDEDDEDNEELSDSSESEQPAVGAKKPDQPKQPTAAAASRKQNKEEDEDEDDMLVFSHRVSGIQVTTVTANPVAAAPSAAGKTAEEPEDDIDIDDI